ncbi:MAG: xylulokinase [bacterium]
MYLLGIDIGTTSIKVGLINEKGGLVSLSIQEYSLKTSSNNRVESYADTYWNSCKAGIRDVLEKSSVSSASIVAIGLSSQGETLVCLDKEGKVLRNVIVWLDSRAVEESEIIGREIPIELWYRTTGLSEVSPMWPICKILWIKRNEPDIFGKTSKFLVLKDYLIWKLTGEFVTDPSVSSSTGYLSIVKRDWWDDALNILGIGHEKLPSIMESHTLIGRINLEVSKELGLPSGIPVINGGMDQMVGALGAGNIKPGIITETTGTALAIIATTDEPIFDPQRRVPCSPHCIPNKYILMPYTETAGILLRWFRDNFPSINGIEDYDRMLSLANQIPPGSDGLIVIPYFNGSFCPNFNPNARGAFVGVTLNHSRAHFIRAIVEAVSFMLRENIDLLRSLSIPVERVRALGGASKSDIWLQMKSDVLNLPVEVPLYSEASVLGAGILAGIGCGIFSNFKDAVERAVKIIRVFKPDPKVSVSYEKVYQDYLSLYKKLYNYCRT